MRKLKTSVQNRLPGTRRKKTCDERVSEQQQHGVILVRDKGPSRLDEAQHACGDPGTKHKGDEEEADHGEDGVVVVLLQGLGPQVGLLDDREEHLRRNKTPRYII